MLLIGYPSKDIYHACLPLADMHVMCVLIPGCVHRYPGLRLPVSLRDGVFFSAPCVTASEYRSTSRVGAHVLQGRLPDDAVRLVAHWELHQMCLAGERKPLGYVGSQQQQQDLTSSGARLLTLLHAALAEAGVDASDSTALLSVKLHSVIEHAPRDILAHGHQRHYSAQHWEKRHGATKADYRATSKHRATIEKQMAGINQVCGAVALHVQLGCIGGHC